MDKSWMKTQITSKNFKDGVESFIDFARVKAIRGSIVCPCMRCCNDKWLDADIVHVHILKYGFLPGYTTWTFHGEHCTPPISQSTSTQEMFSDRDNMERLIRDALGVTSPSLNTEELRNPEVQGNIGETSGVNPHSQQCDNSGEIGVNSHSQQCDNSVENNRYQKLLEESEKDLYPGCKYSNLSFTLHLFQIKCIAGISNKGLGMLLELISDAFPHLTSLPSSVNEAKKLTQDLGLGYQKIDACPNDCMIYWGDRKDQQSCHRCKMSRYKSDLGAEHGQSSKSPKSNKPAKVFRYFPLIP
uniref:uncharacterized protein LOC122592849 n=1 Tax=Erigeron canadensis TaxID=72917 RepID=UPI001CB900FA|nr:uncharacterized protein LOC122592849 [Erigeron canadensis]